MPLTSKELMLVTDNVRMIQNGVNFLRATSEIVTEPQIRTLCTQMAQEHERDISLLIKHVTSQAVQ